MTTESSVVTPVTNKICPLCPPETALKALAEFGTANSRPDGHNLYCKPCINAKVLAGRIKARQRKQERRERSEGVLRLAPEVTRQRPLPMSPEDCVKEAIRRGNHTQEEIRREAKLSDGELGTALANLMLWTKEVKRIDDFHYVLNRDAHPRPVVATTERAEDIEQTRANLVIGAK